MMRTSRSTLVGVAVLLLSCLPMRIHAIEPKVPVSKRLVEILKWTAADEDAAMNRLIDCLSDEREIEGATLRGPSKRVWELLQSRTNIRVSVRTFALHHLCQHADKSKKLLAKRVHQLDGGSKVDRAKDWSPADGYPVFRLLHALAEVHSSQLARQGIIPETQVILEIKSSTGSTVVTRSSLTIIAGYVDHRDKKFSTLVSGVTNRGKGQINATRRNILSLVDAIRDSNIKKDGA